ncbi:hypothetical protein [Candidatus Odyssella thessalonicensis]|uniref:hypothetical protein n=1 Tax=Candidatus Odyssella thessalonicensis TaxID=84647 RepID=UPI000225B1B0|nr:hypothetical protein [Candidatus Odyssella thessalonicensis]
MKIFINIFNNFLLSSLFLSSVIAGERLEQYIEECQYQRQRIAAIVGCGRNHTKDFYDGQTNMEAHHHIGRYFFIDENPAVDPDLCMEFREITDKVIPDQTFQTIYFEYMTNYLKLTPEAYFEAAYRMLKPGGIVAFDATLWDNPEAWRLVPLFDALKAAGFLDIVERASDPSYQQANPFNSRPQGVIIAKRPLR